MYKVSIYFSSNIWSLESVGRAYCVRVSAYYVRSICFSFWRGDRKAG